MVLRKLAAVVPVITALAFAVPVAGASAQTTAAAGSPGSTIPCYPYPAFCGPGGQPWFPLQPSLPTSLPFQGLTPLPGFPLPG
jgi:hypothetical protein